MLRKCLIFMSIICLVLFSVCTVGPDYTDPDHRKVDPTTLLWYRQPADKWENALPVGNGRLGAMVFGKTDEEQIQFNEETYWSGGPYNQTVKVGNRA